MIERQTNSVDKLNAMTPRTLTQALDNGFKIKNIYNKGGKRCRVDVESRHFIANGKNFYSFWLTSKHVERNYPNAYASK